jgi:hypothetical protein
MAAKVRHYSATDSMKRTHPRRDADASGKLTNKSGDNE